MCMRFNLFRILLAVLICVLVGPILLTLGWSIWGRPHEAPQAIQPILVYVEGVGLTEMDLEEYIKGVVAAEMPAYFELEALKAQAVAARTYAVRKIRAYGGPGCTEHPGADICTDFRHGQAWISFADLKSKYGFFSNLRILAKIDRAVEETKGIVATYNGKPIDAIYHANSGGITEDSEKVWGNYIPYLRSIKTDLPGSQRGLDQKSIGLSELSGLLGVQLNPTSLAHAGQLVPGEVISVSTSQQNMGLTVLERSRTGRVVSLALDGQIIRGIDFRSLLGLKSTNFTWRVEGNQVTFSTIGNGHGVGMCQYGANALAQQGKGYQEILTHFYTGINLELFADLRF